MSPDDIAVRAADAARAAAALNPAPYWVVAAVPADGQPWINVVDAFQREDDARARLARLSIAPRLFAGVYANDGAGNLTLIDLWGPEYRRYQTRVDDTRGIYGNKIARVSGAAAAPSEKTNWIKWAAIGAAVVGGFVFLVRPAMNAEAAGSLKTPGTKKRLSEGGYAYWDAYTARHRQ